MRPLKPRTALPPVIRSPRPAPPGRLGGRGTLAVGEGPAGCCRAARGKPISQIIGSDPTVVPRYPAFIRLPDWGPGAGRRRRGSNYGCSCPVARGWRRGGRAGRGGQSGFVCAAAGLAAGLGGICPPGGPGPASYSVPPRGLLRPPAQLPHCLLWSLCSPSRPLLRVRPPSLPLPSPLLPKERRASLWRRMSHE